METIASVPTDTKEGEYDSSATVNANQDPFSNNKIYSTLYDVQPELIRLYTGEYK